MYSETSGQRDKTPRQRCSTNVQRVDRRVPEPGDTCSLSLLLPVICIVCMRRIASRLGDVSQLRGGITARDGHTSHNAFSAPGGTIDVCTTGQLLPRASLGPGDCARAVEMYWDWGMGGGLPKSEYGS